MTMDNKRQYFIFRTFKTKGWCKSSWIFACKHKHTLETSKISSKHRVKQIFSLLGLHQFLSTKTFPAASLTCLFASKSTSSFIFSRAGHQHWCHMISKLDRVCAQAKACLHQCDVFARDVFLIVGVWDAEQTWRTGADVGGRTDTSTISSPDSR